MDRKSFFTDGMQDLARKLYSSPLGRAIDRRLQGAANLLAPEGLSHHIESRFSHPAFEPGVEESIVRPPGAVDEFEELCTKCGDCESACPHGTIFKIEESGPLINPNITACLLCEDYPCIHACKTGALLALEEDELPGFGRLQVDEKLCANHGLTKNSKPAFACSECIEACPVPNALQMPRDGLIPQPTEFCNGCGQCLPLCPVFPIALKIVPLAEEVEEEIGEKANL